ncbi:MAG: hypothetical protein NXI32_10785 [bacterium]|nr:hypothetical protein [bacterium]
MDSKTIWKRMVQVAAGALVLGLTTLPSLAQRRYAASDNMSGFVHWIELFDADSRRIDPRDPAAKPYSPEKTCGRCHDYTTISHGWHFNAVDDQAHHGRPGQPWVWSDERTGTHLPLSYRGWKGTYNPDELGMTRWEVAAKLGGYMPGGGVGSAESVAQDSAATEQPEFQPEQRASVTGPLPVDCMMCHHNTGSGYSPFVWTEQIEQQNFAYAPTAAAGLARVSGGMSRIADDFDPSAEGAADKLPKLEYDIDRFASDGKVFFDLVREPKNDSCYYCHTNMPADAVTGQRWLHDEDVHLQAGMSCVDCHRNALDHHMVRGFDGEVHPAGSLVAALSCQGCHMSQPADAMGEPGVWEKSDLANVGRLGAPLPQHRGLPPLHFEKMTCTACHAGPAPETQLGRQMNSIAHRLGEHWKRTGEEQPGIVAAIHLPVSYSDTSSEHSAGEEAADTSGTSVYTPHRLMWPSMWGTLGEDGFQVLHPEQAYALLKKPLKVRREFTEELADVSLSLTERKELLGEDRARVKDEERTAEENAKLQAAEAEKRKAQVSERMVAALEALEEEFPGKQAVFVSGGVGFVRDAEEGYKPADDPRLNEVVAPYAWPIAHNVRPARQSLGATGCLECHSQQSSFFHSVVTPVGVLPDQPTVSKQTHEMQQADMLRLTTWNQMFAGRALFKVAALLAFGLTVLIFLAALSSSLSGAWRRKILR